MLLSDLADDTGSESENLFTCEQLPISMAYDPQLETAAKLKFKNVALNDYGCALTVSGDLKSVVLHD